MVGATRGWKLFSAMLNSRSWKNINNNTMFVSRPCCVPPLPSSFPPVPSPNISSTFLSVQRGTHSHLTKALPFPVPTSSSIPPLVHSPASLLLNGGRWRPSSAALLLIGGGGRPLLRSCLLGPPSHSYAFYSARAFGKMMRGGLSSWSSALKGTRVPSKRGYSSSTWGHSQRRLDPNVALWSLIGANCVVFGAWNVLSPSFMFHNFTVSVEGISEGRLHTLLLSAFSQKDGWHLLSNMFGLFFFGGEIGLLYGGSFLLALYAAGGVVGSISHVAYHRLIKPRMRTKNGSRNFFYNALYSPPALGASGAVNAIVLLNCLLFPKRIIFLNLFIPVPAILLGIGFVCRDLLGATSDSSNIGHAAHLGGAACGVLAFFLLKSKRKFF